MLRRGFQEQAKVTRRDANMFAPDLDVFQHGSTAVGSRDRLLDNQIEVADDDRARRVSIPRDQIDRIALR